MTWKEKLIEEVGEDKATKLLSDMGKEMSSQVKHRYKGFADPAHQELAQRKLREKREKETAKTQNTTKEDPAKA